MGFGFVVDMLFHWNTLVLTRYSALPSLSAIPNFHRIAKAILAANVKDENHSRK